MTPETNIVQVNPNRRLHIFLGVVGTVMLGVGAYALYQYDRIKKINETVVTPQQAIDYINSTR